MFNGVNPGGVRVSRGSARPRRSLLQVRVLFGFVDGPELLHVFLDVLLRLVLHVLVALQVLRVLAVFQLLVHDSVSQLQGGGRAGNAHRYSR